VGEALERLFRDEWPDFIQEKLDGMKEGAEWLQKSYTIP
jgi:hypothetical protein